MPKFVDLATNAPPVDPSLVKTNIIPTFRDVAPPQFVDDEPEKAPIELLAERIDTDPKFVPSNEQLDEYFDYKDKQPFSFSKVRDFAVNTVGALITDVGKAVASAANDPDFVLGPGTKLISYLAGGADPETAAKATLAGPAKRAVTTAEAAARGTWDLSILGRQLTDKMEELNKDSWSGWADFAVEEHNKKYPKNKITKTGLYHDGYKEINPGDLQKLKAKWGKTKNQARRDAWRTMRYMINTRANAAEGKQTILSEFFDKDVDKALRPFINNNVAEGGSYVLDASAPVGFLAAPMKAGAKAPVTSLLVTKTGEMVKAGGKKAESAAELLSSKFKSLQDEIIETELPQPKQIGALETGARIFTVAGDGLEALGRAAGQPRTLESTLERAGRTAETQAARRALKTASKFDPLLDTVGSLVSGAKAGTLSGLALTLPTGDEEMIGGAIGSGVAVGGAGGLAGRFAGKKQIIQKQVENTVNEWLNSKSPEERQNIQKLGLTPVEAGNVAVAELLGRGIIGKDKLSDVNFVYLSQDDYLKRFHPEVLVDGKAPADTPFGTRGAQSSVDGTPTVFINTGYNGARSIFHELMHGLLRFDELQDSRAELRSYLFDSKTPDGEVIKKGWFEDGDLDTQFDAYLTMLPEESSAPFLEQFNVYKDVETESGPQRVIDEEATRDRQREYIMEELEAESFANFIQQSGPTFLQQTRSISQKLLDRWFLQDNIRKTGIMKAILGRSGVEFGADGNPTGLFYRDGKPFTNSPELNKLIRDFVRAKDTVNKRMVEDDAGERPAMTIGGRQAKAGRKQIEAAIKSEDGAKVVQHFQNNDIFARDQSGKIVYDVNGVPILLGRKEIEKLQANRREQIMDKLSEVGADPNGMVQESNGSWKGVPTNKQLKAILEVPDSIIAPGMKDTIRDIARKFKTPGQSIIIDYNPALNKSGVYDSNLSSGLRIAVPLGFNVSKSGNFYMTTLDVGAMNMKMADWAKTGQLKSWDGDTKRFYQDVYKYLENHQKDAPGETGIGVDKRNIINDFFGVTADNVNPITDARKAAEASMSPSKRSKAKASANLIRSRRFDRINRIEKNRVSKQAAGTPLPMKSQSDAYRKMQQNLMPGDRSRFMPATPEPRPAQDKLGFFSRVEQVASGNKVPNRGSGEQMLATIAKQPGVKQEEIAWLGLEDFLRGKKQVTKDELVEFIRENDVQLEETMLRENAYQEGEPTRYGEYQLPGAEPGSYRELLLRLPRGSKEKITFNEMLRSPEYKQFLADNDLIEMSPQRERDIYDAYLNDRYLGEYKNIFPDIADNLRSSNFRSSHFSEPNILSHVRFNDRTGPDGEKILFLEELQSDWHKAGRDQGYRDAYPTELERYAVKSGMSPEQARADIRHLLDEPLDNPDRRTSDQWKRLTKATEGSDIDLNAIFHDQKESPVPDAPFKSTWHELTLKRMLRYAAENGYDKLAFIDGKETADRYDLSKRVDKVAISDDETGNLTITADDSLIASDVEPNQLERYVGKEVAQRALQSIEDTSPDMSGNRTTVLTDSDLKVGGQWAFNLYDRMIPQFLKKYGKKFGAKVEDVEVGTTEPSPDTTVMIPRDFVLREEYSYDFDVDEYSLLNREGVSVAGGETAQDAVMAARQAGLFEGETLVPVEVEPADVSSDFPSRLSFKAIDITPQMRGEEGVLGGQVRFMPAALQDSVQAQTNDRPSVGVNINDGQLPFSRWIVDGKQNEDGSIQKKTIETRANPKNNALAKLSKTGERFAIISTFGPKKKQAEIIATARAGSPIMYDTLEKFRADQDKHMVEPGSDFDWDGFKVGYPIEDVRKLEKPVPVPRNVQGIQTRDLSDVRFMPAERNDRKNRVSTRLPTAVAATEDPLASTLLIDSAAVFNLPPEKQKVMAGIITKYPNIRSSSKNLQPVADELKQQSIDNLLWLHDKVPADIRKRSKLWYDGARKITNGYTKEFQITNPAGAGVLAVLSPGKDWFMNVSLAERIIDTAQNKVGKPIDAKMMKQAKFRLEGNAALMNEVKKMVGKKYNDLTPLQKSIWIRMYDEAYNSPNYEIISPEGRKVGLVKKKDGTNANVAHQSFPFIQKAIAVLDDPSRENISGQLGGAHKIRNFYNNILLPKIAKEDVTIDTHAVAAALLRPFAQKSTEVTHNFGAGMPGSSITGAQGTYGIYADAYREAARQRGILPREMQSITWEAVRGLFPNTMKTEKNKALADAIWTDYKRGRKTIDEARKEIEKLFGGIDAPDWYR